PSPVIIPAIDDLRLLRMKFQSALLQTRGYGRPDFLCFYLCPAMHEGIIGEPLKRVLRICRRHPPIKSIVQKQIRQQRADHATLRRSLLTRDQLTVLLFHWRFQPALDVENNPLFLSVLPDRPYQQILRDVIEEAPDVQINNQAIAPASLPRLTHRIQRRLPRSIPVGIRMSTTQSFPSCAYFCAARTASCALRPGRNP